MEKKESNNLSLLYQSQHSQLAKHSDIVSNSEYGQDQDQYELDYEHRKKFRQHKLGTIKGRIEVKTQIKERKKQNIVFYLLNLFFPVMVSVNMALVFLQIGQNSEQKGILLVIAATGGLTSALISNRLIAPSWKEVLKLWVILDSVVPVLLAAVIGFLAVWEFLNKGTWYHLCYVICYPIWVVYMLGTLRVMIAHGNWSPWEIIIYKLVVLFCGLINFYVGFQYMNGKYKISSGFFVALESKLRDLTYLSVFGNVELFFEMFRRLSDFDQTNELKHVYKFKDQADQEKKAMHQAEYGDLQQEVLFEDIHDAIVMQAKSEKRITTKMIKDSSLKESKKKKDVVIEKIEPEAFP